MKKYELGNSSESIILSSYIKAGYRVSIPFGSGASYDLLVDTGFDIFRVQVKTGWINRGVLKYKCLRRQSGKENRRPYFENEADYLAIYCPANEMMYAVPIKGHPTLGWLRLEPVKTDNQNLFAGLLIIPGKNIWKN